MIVQLKQELPQVPAGLSRRMQYRVIEIDGDYYRLVDDDEDPVLYEKDIFDVIDPAIPENWIVEYGSDGEQYARPVGRDPYVWEDYHDGKPDAVAAVKAYIAGLGSCRWPITTLADRDQ